MSLKRFYKNELPLLDDIVLGRVVSLGEFGIKVRLPEYNNIDAFLNYKDASTKKKLYQIKKQVKINREYPMTVIEVNQEKKYINLSKKYLVESEEVEFKEFYNKYKICKLIMANFNRKKKIRDMSRIIDYYDKILWKYDKNEIYDIFNKIKKNEISVNSNIFDLTNDEYSMLYEIIQEKIKDIKFSVKFILKINSLHYDGKKKIIDFLQLISDTMNSEAFVICVPNYCIKFKGVLKKNLDTFIDKNKKLLNSIEKKNILFNIENIEKHEE